MSRRRPRRSIRADIRGEEGRSDATTRFRIVCTCSQPPVIIERFLAHSDPDRRQQGLEQLGRVLIQRMSTRDAPFWVEDVPDGQGGAQKKPRNWRCPKCGVNPGITLDRAHQLAHEYLLAGVSSLDVSTLARTLGEQ